MSDQRLAEAKDLKTRGTAAFKSSEWKAAEEAYSSASKLLEHDLVMDASRPSRTREDEERMKETRDVALSCRLNASMCALKLEEWATAERLCDSVLSLDKQSAKALYRRGVARMAQSYPTEALDDLKAAARIDPNSKEIRTQLSACLDAVKELRKAGASSEKALTANMFNGMGGREGLYQDRPDTTWKGQTRPRVFFDLSVSGLPVGRVVFELWPDLTPICAENFRALCTGEYGVGKYTRRRLHYKGTCFHRVMEGFGIMAGDIGKKGEHGYGKGGESIYGGEFEDRSCVAEGAPHHDGRVGLLSMGNGNDKPPEVEPPEKPKEWVNFGSRFQIMLHNEPIPELDRKSPVFGIVVEGLDVILAVASTPVGAGYRPTLPIIIDDCGEVYDHERSGSTRYVQTARCVGDCTAWRTPRRAAPKDSHASQGG